MKQNILKSTIVAFWWLLLAWNTALSEEYITKITVDVRTADKGYAIYLAEVFVGRTDSARATDQKGIVSTTIHTDDEEPLDLRVTYPGFQTIHIPDAIIIGEDTYIKCKMVPEPTSDSDLPPLPGEDPQLDYIYSQPLVPGFRTSVQGLVLNASNDKPVWKCRLSLIASSEARKKQLVTGEQNRDPQQQSEVSFDSLPLPGNNTKTFQTDKRGLFRMTKLFPGFYTIVAWKPGFLPDTLYDIRVDQARTTDLIIRLYEDYNVSQAVGKTVNAVTGEAISDAEIRIAEHGIKVVSSLGGFFDLRNITPGKPYTLDIYHHLFREKHIEEMIFTDNPSDTVVFELEYRPVQLVSNYTEHYTIEEVLAFNLNVVPTLPRATWIQGQVFDAASSEQPLSACTVSLVGSPWIKHTKADGNFVIGDITPGEYTLVFEYPGYIPLTLPLNLQNAEPIVLCKVRLQPED